MPEYSSDVEAGGFAGTMTAQGLQIGSSEDSLTGLGIVTDGFVIVDIVLGIEIADGRRRAVRV